MSLWRPSKWKVTVIGSLVIPRRGSAGRVEGLKRGPGVAQFTAIPSDSTIIP
jgi:hypothetical protein